MNRRFLTAVPVAALAIGIAACGPNSGYSSGDSVPSIFTPGPSYTAQASAAVSDAAQAAQKCQPKGTTTQDWEVSLLLHSSARQAFYTCEKIPKADDDAVAACALTAAENAHKAAGTSASKETGFLNAMAACVNNPGATPSATPTPAASRT